MLSLFDMIDLMKEEIYIDVRVFLSYILISFYPILFYSLLLWTEANEAISYQ